MATIWLTYAWEDNKSGDVDFLAQEIESSEVKVKLDRWNLQAGKRLWEQIANFIQEPSECDAWVLYATQNSLGSEPCKEEFAYALDRALQTRGNVFPVIGLFPSSVDSDLIPAGIRTRLYVSLTDIDWKERIRAAAEGRIPAIAKHHVDPYFIHVYSPGADGVPYTIEVRPRAGTWSPFFAAIPLTEKDSVNPFIVHGPKDRPVISGNLFMYGSGESNDKKAYGMYAQNEATPTQSYYISCQKLPSKLFFGVYGGLPQFEVTFANQ
jgi:hypothetical protein